jgi:hypothetical protein
MEDRRKMQRFPLRLPCLIHDVNDARNPPLLEAQTLNVGTGGALVETEQQLPVGTDVHFNMLIRRSSSAEPINAGSCVSLTGRVLRKDEMGLGIAFSEAYRIVPTSQVFGQSNAVSHWLWQIQKKGKMFRVASL